MTPTDGGEDSNMYMYIMKSGTQRLALMLDRTEAVFNDDSQDINFRVESDNDANALFVWGQYGHTGLGTNTPQKKLVISDGGAQGVEISPAESGVSRIFSYNRSSNAYTPINIQGSDLRFGLGTSNTEKVRFQSGGGISFNGDTAAANALDDYEEGSWTPTFQTSNGNGSFTVTINYAKYIKVGGLVHVDCYLSANISDAGSGAAEIHGLPYVHTNGQGYSVASFVHTSAIIAQPSHGFAGYVTNGHSYIRVVSVSGAPTNIGWQSGNPVYLMLSAVYHSV